MRSFPAVTPMATIVTFVMGASPFPADVRTTAYRLHAKWSEVSAPDQNSLTQASTIDK
jgi:hypothetical protein